MMSWLYRFADAVRRYSRNSDQGRLGEDLAHRYLRSRGCTVVARNYRARSGAGEIDLVAWHGGKLVFVEVKTRATAAFGAPERAVDQEKQAHIRRAAREYTRRAGVDWSKARFDIVSIVAAGKQPQIEWLQDAFGEDGRVP
jgi:putative endonuclease